MIVGRTLIASAAATAASAFAAAALACSCMAWPSAAEHLAEADAAFRGQVTETRRGAESRATTTFRVESVLKGRLGRTVIVRHATEGEACGVTYVTGQSYLVIAVETSGSLFTGVCYAPQFEEAEYRRAAAAGAAQSPR